MRSEDEDEAESCVTKDIGSGSFAGRTGVGSREEATQVRSRAG